MCVGFSHSFFIYFNHLTIISHQSVHFHLHIRSLSINSRRESPDYQVIKHICIFYILISYFFGRIKLYISPVTIRFPNMIFHYPTDTTILSQNISSLGIIQIHFGSRIIMQVKHIATSIMVTSTCRIYQTGRIIFFSPFCNFRSLELPHASLNGTHVPIHG